MKEPDDEVARLRQRVKELEAQNKELKEINVQPGISIGAALEWKQRAEAAEARVKELEEYKRRVELSIKASSAFMDDEVIRRKQAEALRWAAGRFTHAVRISQILEIADAIERGEVEI